jgi:hypothetical protein
MERKSQSRNVRLLSKIQKVSQHGRYPTMRNLNESSHGPSEVLKPMLLHMSRNQANRHSREPYRDVRRLHHDGTLDQRLTAVGKPGHKQPWLTSQFLAPGAGSPAMESSKSITAPRSTSRPLLFRGLAPSRSSCCSSSARSAAALSTLASSDQSTSPDQSSNSSESSPCRHRRTSGNSSCRKGYVSVSPTACISAQQCLSSAPTSSGNEH